VIDAMTTWLADFYEVIKNDILLLVPIIVFMILVAVDYYVGTSFVLEQYKSELFEVRGMDSFILNIKIYSMSFMVFGVVLLMIEFANKRLFDIYNNTFVQGIKWLFSAIIVSGSFLGVLFYLGATRFFAGNLDMQVKLENIGLILVWFGLVFVCSLLFNEIKNSNRGFAPVITLFELIITPFIAVSLVMFSLIWIVEFTFKSFFIYLSYLFPQSQSRVLEKTIKNAKIRVDDFEKRINKMESSYDTKVTEEKQLIENAITKAEEAYQKNIAKIELDFASKAESLNKKITEINNIEALFREGSDHAVIDLWGKYIFI
ncbi:MAG: hypothetical protein NT091_02455, partial [Candidatus Falkowbacteria bacterium]|nr:hypothetical protein [Candidatus Falkowbacteria bacterium]